MWRRTRTKNKAALRAFIGCAAHKNLAQRAKCANNSNTFPPLKSSPGHTHKRRLVWQHKQKLPILTLFNFFPCDCLARCFSLLFAKCSVLFHCAPHFDLQPIYLVANIVHLAIKTIVQLEVALLSKAAASHVALSEYFNVVVLAKAAVWVLFSALQFSLFAANNLQNVAARGHLLVNPEAEKTLELYAGDRLTCARPTSGT